MDKPIVQPSKVREATEADQSGTPLLNAENQAKLKWASKLEAIGQRAGDRSKLLIDTTNTEGLTPGETARLRQLVLSSGAHRTIAVRVMCWERFEDWLTAAGYDVFPLSSEKLLKYALALDARDCGPTVIPSFRTAVRWVTSKLAIDCPDLSHPALLAVQNDVVQKRATTLKEAVPFPIEAVGCMEIFVCSETESMAARLFVWWWLCMIFASLRFDDAMHVKPKELQLQDEGLFGVAWQTKVERRRRGTKFVVPKVGFKNSEWLTTGWQILQLEDLDRDFWIRDLGAKESFRDEPAQYQRSILWARFLAKCAVNSHFEGSHTRIKEVPASLCSMRQSMQAAPQRR